jgi:hypothetical protein
MDRCDAPLRKKPGQFCRARPLKGQRRCRLHAGRPKGSGSPEGQAATEAGRAAYVAKRRAAKARGEPVSRSGGRRKKWLIPRWWRFQLSPGDEARVLAHMAAYDARVRGGEPRPPWQANTSTRIEARSLEACERALILAMNDPQTLLDGGRKAAEIERAYDNVRAAEAMLGLAGADVRLHRLAWERERLLERARAMAARTLEGEPAPSPPATELPNPPAAQATAPDTFRDVVCPREAVERELAAELAHAMSQISYLPLAASARAGFDRELANAEGTAERLQVCERWFAALGRTEAIVGHYIERAEARAAARVDDWRPSSIAPWLAQKG